MPAQGKQLIAYKILINGTSEARPDLWFFGPLYPDDLMIVLVLFVHELIPHYRYIIF
jgi:hypothetical protein